MKNELPFHSLNIEFSYGSGIIAVIYIVRSVNSTVFQFLFFNFLFSSFLILNESFSTKFYNSHRKTNVESTTKTPGYPHNHQEYFIYNFDFKLPINFSNFMAFCKSPDIFNFPLIKAEAAFNFPKEKSVTIDVFF